MTSKRMSNYNTSSNVTSISTNTSKSVGKSKISTKVASKEGQRHISLEKSTRRETLTKIYSKYQRVFLITSFLLLSFTPFFEPLETFFIMTIGFSMLYIAFGIILIHFLVSPNINQQLNTIFSKRIVDFVSKIGYCSYSIYVIHTFVIYCESFLRIENKFLGFTLVFVGSIVAGFVMTYTIEDYFLKIRNKLFPNRVL